MFDFVRLNWPMFLGSEVSKDPKKCIYKFKKIFRVRLVLGVIG